jgi:ferredoxin
MPNSMAVRHRVTVHNRQSGLTHSAELAEGDYVLQGFESLGTPLPFSCRNGCCTACAVRVLAGSIDQKEALGLSKDLRSKGWGLLCVARVDGPLEVETQGEDEVYMLQFGNAFARGQVRKSLPLEAE